jgi:hypothetical protein
MAHEIVSPVEFVLLFVLFSSRVVRRERAAWL